MITKNDFDLTDYNSYRIKSTAKLTIFPERTEDIKKVFEEYSNKNIITIGKGNNILLSKDFYDETCLFLIIGDSFSSIKMINEATISVLSGTDIKKFSLFAYENGLSGLEVFYDIPGSVGGIVNMNAGAYNEYISDIVLNVTYYDKEKNDIFTVSSSNLKWSYRESFFNANKTIILSVEFKLIKKEKEVIYDKMISLKEKRALKQPKDYPNAGSVFKRPEGYFVGKLVEDCGLKGFMIGGAKISEKHAGFIINYNNASGEDIISLINHIKSDVYSKYGVTLELEQRII